MELHSPTEAENVLDGIRRLVRFLRVSSRASEAHLGLSSAQLFILQKLAEAPAASISELARRALADASSVSTVLTRLVAKGLVRRRSSESDARRRELEVTAKGRTLLARAPEPAQEKLLEALQSLRPADRRALARGLSSLVAALGLAEGAAPLFFEQESPDAKPRN